MVDGINIVGFSGGPVVRTPPGRMPIIIGVISGYKATQEPVYQQNSKTLLSVQSNTGLMVAYPIDFALEAISRSPNGFRIVQTPSN